MGMGGARCFDIQIHFHVSGIWLLAWVLVGGVLTGGDFLMDLYVFFYYLTVFYLCCNSTSSVPLHVCGRVGDIVFYCVKHLLA